MGRNKPLIQTDGVHTSQFVERSITAGKTLIKYIDTIVQQGTKDSSLTMTKEIHSVSPKPRTLYINVKEADDLLMLPIIRRLRRSPQRHIDATVNVYQVKRRDEKVSHIILRKHQNLPMTTANPPVRRSTTINEDH